MAYEKLKIGVSPLTKCVYVGTVKEDSKGRKMWQSKCDKTAEFLSACIDYFETGTENTLTVDGKPYLIITAKKAE